MRRVALVGPRADLQLKAVAAEIKALGGTPVHMDFSTVERGNPLVLGGRQRRLGKVPLDRMDAAYVRQIPGPWPPISHGDDGKQVVLQKWMGPFMLAKEREQAALGVLLEWHARGVRLLNPPSSTGFVQNKPFQLQRANQLGISIPSTLITNDPAKARAFIKRHGDVIAKPVHGGALTVQLSTEDPGPLERIRAAPIILQKRIVGDDIRLMMLGNRVLSCAAIRLPEGNVLDFRGSDTYQGGNASYQEVTLDADVRRHAAMWMKSLGLILAGIDLKRGARGKFTFLECNSSPIYLDQEWKTGDGISRGIARWLVQRTKRLST